MPTTTRGLTTTEWLICGIAALGFAFEVARAFATNPSDFELKMRTLA